MSRVPIIEVKGATRCQAVLLLAGISDPSVDPREPEKIARGEDKHQAFCCGLTADGITAEIIRKR
jgi:hypothetical protein